MKVSDLHIGMKVQRKVTGFPMHIIGIYSNLEQDPRHTTVLCDFPDNEGDVWEYDFNEIEIAEEEKQKV